MQYSFSYERMIISMTGAEIIKSLELSACAYRDIQPYFSHTCTAIIDDIKTDVQCFLRRKKDTLWITFRGSDSIKDWKTNFNLCKKVIPYNNTKTNIRVHCGFLNAYKAPNVRNAILSAITKNTHYVRVSGHSLGAALATLCAVDIQYNFPDRDIETILFGCPRVGNENFKKSYNKRVNKTIRIENGNDIITKLPFPFMGYRHVGAKLHIGFPKIPLCFSRKDHSATNYYSGILSKFIF